MVTGDVGAEPTAHHQDQAPILHVRRRGHRDGVLQPGHDLLQGGRLHLAGPVHDELQTRNAEAQVLCTFQIQRAVRAESESGTLQ